MCLGLSGPWVAAHFELEQWAQRRKKQKVFEGSETIPGVAETTVAKLWS